MLAILLVPLPPSTTGECLLAHLLLSLLMSEQKEAFFFSANECASRSRSRKCFLRLSRRISYLYLLLACLFIVDEVGQPASSQTLCQNIEAFLSFPADNSIRRPSVDKVID